jgi:hypothetical protein
VSKGRPEPQVMKGSFVAYIPGSHGDSLKQYLERRSRGADPERALVDGHPLVMRRKTSLGLMVCALVSVEFWVWTLIVPWLKQSGFGQRTNYAGIADAAVGLLISIALVTVILAAAVMLFTEVDSRGIHRPDWAGGDFIPWSSVTEVSSGASPEVLQVRAGEKKINLSLMLFSNPAALVALIRRHVAAERLKGI